MRMSKAFCAIDKVHKGSDRVDSCKGDRLGYVNYVKYYILVMFKFRIISIIQSKNFIKFTAQWHVILFYITVTKISGGPLVCKNTGT